MKVASTLAALALCALSQAGEFGFVPGAWTLLENKNSNSSQIVTTSTNPSGSIAVTASGSLAQRAQGRWAFSVTWKPTSAGETPPTSVRVYFKRVATPSVAGNGTARVLEPVPNSRTTNEVLKVDSTRLILSGITTYLTNVVVTAPLTLRSDGTYRADGSVTSDLLEVTTNTSTLPVTKCTETYQVRDLQGVL